MCCFSHKYGTVVDETELKILILRLLMHDKGGDGSGIHFNQNLSIFMTSTRLTVQ